MEEERNKSRKQQRRLERRSVHQSIKTCPDPSELEDWIEAEQAGLNPRALKDEESDS
jgi:hypothetical protein